MSKISKVILTLVLLVGVVMTAGLIINANGGFLSSNLKNTNGIVSQSDKNDDILSSSSPSDDESKPSESITIVDNESSDASSDVSEDTSSEDNTFSGIVSDTPIRDIDDEIIENNDDEHTSIPVLTDNEQFNELFQNNSIDKQYDNELKYCESSTEMVNKTNEYAQKWYNEVFNAYDLLITLVDDEKAQYLQESFDEWASTVSDTVNQYNEEARLNGGTNVQILEASNKIMIFYRTQAAEYYKQIYEITGDCQLVED